MKDSRLGYPDLLRCLAAFAVVVLHCAGATLAAEDPASARFFILNLLDGGARWAVPVFVMLSGMFLLDPDRELTAKRWLGHVGRIALACVIWSFLYGLWDNRAVHLGAEWLLEGLICLVTGRLHYHLWYLPMLLGLYLLIPLLRAFLKGADRKTLWYVIALWAVAAVCLPTLFVFFPNSPLRAWSNMLGLYLGYLGLFLLGYALKTCQLGFRGESILYALGAAGAVVTCTGTRLLSLAVGHLTSPLYEYLTPNVCLAAAALFLLCRRLRLGKSPLWSRLAPYTFGVYLIHPVFVDSLSRRLPAFSSWYGTAAGVVGLAVVSFALAFACAWVVRHIPGVGKRLC